MSGPSIAIFLKVLKNFEVVLLFVRQLTHSIIDDNNLVFSTWREVKLCLKLRKYQNTLQMVVDNLISVHAENKYAINQQLQ